VTTLPAAEPARLETRAASPGLGAVVPGLVLLAAVLAAYAPSLGGRFVWDDTSLILRNDALGSWSGLVRLLGSDVSSIGGDAPGAYWRPLTILSFFVDRLFWGLNPVGFHLTNVLLHALVALSLFSLLRALGASSLAAALGAALQSLHPAATESVAWISGRTDVLAALLVLAAARVILGRGRASTAIAAALAALAVLAKETAVAAPAAFLALDFALRPHDPERTTGSRLARHAVVAAAAGLAFLARFAVLDAPLPAIPGAAPLGERLLAAPRILAAYAGKALFPVAPNAEWEPAASGPLGAPDVLAFAALGAIVAGAFLLRRRGPGALAAAGIGLAFLAPALGVAVPLPETAAERFLYLPLLGAPFLALARWPLAAAPPVAATALAFLAATALRVPVWSDPVALFSDAASKPGDRSRALYNLANERLERGLGAHREGDMERARVEYDAALDLYASAEVMNGPDAEKAILGIAAVHAASGRDQDAYETLRAGLERFPDSFPLLVEMGKARRNLGDDDGAIAALRRATAARPDVAEPFALLGGLYLRRRDLATARGYLETAVELEPRDPLALQMLASAIAEASGGTDGAALDRALDLFKKSLALDPTNVTTMEGMAKILVYARTGPGGAERLARLDAARSLLMEAIRIEGRASLYRILSDACAMLGKFDEARHFLRVVIEANPPDVEAWKKRLAEIDLMEGK